MLPSLIRVSARSSRTVRLPTHARRRFCLLDYVLGISLLCPWMLRRLRLGLGLLGTIGVPQKPRIAFRLKSKAAPLEPWESLSGAGRALSADSGRRELTEQYTLGCPGQFLMSFDPAGETVSRPRWSSVALKVLGTGCEPYLAPAPYLVRGNFRGTQGAGAME
jgi:hypothetical protein